MGIHERYGKDVLNKALKSFYGKTLEEHKLDIESCRMTIRIDGVIMSRAKKKLCAVEIEARTPKQIRGAVLDLVLYNQREDCRRNLLMIIPTPTHNYCKDDEKKFCKLLRLLSNPIVKNKVIVLNGNGISKRLRSDVQEVKKELSIFFCVKTIAN